jgi:hypothetical protein
MPLACFGNPSIPPKRTKSRSIFYIHMRPGARVAKRKLVHKKDPAKPKAAKSGWRPPPLSDERRKQKEKQSAQRKRKISSEGAKRWNDWRNVDIGGVRGAWVGRQPEFSTMLAPTRRNGHTSTREVQSPWAQQAGKTVLGMNGKPLYSDNPAAWRGSVGYEAVDETTCRLVDGCIRPRFHTGICELAVHDMRGRRGAPRVPRSTVCDSSGCRICFDVVDDQCAEVEGEAEKNTGGVTRCGHLFHTSCLSKWLQQQHAEKKAAVCAVCRSPLAASTKRMFARCI